ncbi:MAG TPA: PPOX class F420-dependent oxidoreductase [Anaerolineae bacterium]|nr:PPOX class F420-dependent oxidoreductase [Anaerolineae bacterium]
MLGIPNEYVDLLSDEKRSFAFLATIMNDGTPQVTPVWFNTDGENILINSAKGRVKDTNIRVNPYVAIAIVDPTDMYRYLQIRGKVVEITEKSAREHINALCKKYTGEDVFNLKSPEEVRVIYKIRPINME